MVWVSNQSSGTIVVSITNNSGGDEHDFTIFSRELENRQTNNWTRGGNETMKLRMPNGNKKSLTVGKDNYVIVHDDAVLLMNCSEIKV